MILSLYSKTPLLIREYLLKIMMILLDGQEGALDDVIGCQIFGTHSMNGAQF